MDSSKSQGLGRGGALLWIDWDDGYSVFSAATGETHQLSELPAEALRQLAVAPMSTHDLCATLAAACEADNSAEWQAKIDGILAELFRSELIVPVGAGPDRSVSAWCIARP